MVEKILFLDFDDVLNTSDTLNRGELFENENIQAFNTIMDRVAVDIVITSTWRVAAHPEELEELLKAAGGHVSGRVIGSTPWLDGESRGAEISAWFKKSRTSTSPFVILDNRTDMDDFLPFLVQTDPQHGLVYSQAEEVVNRLEGACDLLI